LDYILIQSSESNLLLIVPTIGYPNRRTLTLFGTLGRFKQWEVS